MQLISFDNKISSEKTVASKQAAYDIGTFVYAGTNYEAFGDASTHTVTYVIDNVHHIQLTATGTYTASNGDRGTIRTAFNDYLGNHVAYAGVYFV